MLPTNSKGKAFEVFEFLLNFDLVDEYLDSERKDELACELIVNFLYAASLSEQRNKQRIQSGDARSGQSDRSIAFGLLAMKAAAVIEWDLCVMEERIPAVAIGDLLNTFVSQCIGSDKNCFNVDLDSTPDHLTFGIQLFCRWHVRAVIQANFVKKPDKTMFTSNFSDPLKHIHQANKQALENLSARVGDAVQALERCYLVLRDLIRPTSECFKGPTNDFRGFSIDWQKGERYPKSDLLAHVAYDLGVHYFIHKRFSEASAFLNNAVELSKRCTSRNAQLYFRDAEAFANTSSALSTSVPRPKLIDKLKNSEQDLFISLIDDNQTRSLDFAERVAMEKMQNLTPSQKSIIEACNIVYSWIHKDVPLKTPRNVMCPLLRKALQSALISYPKCARLQLLISLYVGDLLEEPSVAKESHTDKEKGEFAQESEVELPCSVRLRKAVTTYNTKQLLLLMSQMTTNELSLAKDIFVRQVPSLPAFVCDSLANADPHIGTYIVAIFMKAHKCKQNKDFRRAHNLLNSAVPFLEDFARVRKYVQCEILYYEIQICKQGSTKEDVDDDLTRRVTGFLNNLPRETDAPIYVIRASLAFMLSLRQWNFVASLRKLNFSIPCLEAAILIAKICLSFNANEMALQKGTRDIDKFCLLMLEESSPDDVASRKNELLLLASNFRNNETMNAIIRVLANATRTGTSFMTGSELIDMRTFYQSPELVNILSRFLRYAIISQESPNCNRIYMYAEVLSKLTDKTIMKRGYLELVLSIASIANRRKTIRPDVAGHLSNLAFACKRYFEAAFWVQYTEASDRYAPIYTEILRQGTLDFPENILPFIFDTALLEFLAAALAEKGSIALWNLAVKRMHSLDCHSNTDNRAMSCMEDERCYSFSQGVFEIVKSNYQISHLLSPYCRAVE